MMYLKIHVWGRFIYKESIYKTVHVKELTWIVADEMLMPQIWRWEGSSYPNWKERTVQRSPWEILWGTMPAWGNFSGIEPGKKIPAFTLFPPSDFWPLAEPTKSQRVQEPLELIHIGQSSHRRLRAATRRAESVSKITSRRWGRHFCYFGSWLYLTCSRSIINTCLGLCSKKREWPITQLLLTGWIK